jgi:hypothetical protein
MMDGMTASKIAVRRSSYERGALSLALAPRA